MSAGDGDGEGSGGSNGEGVGRSGDLLDQLFQKRLAVLANGLHDLLIMPLLVAAMLDVDNPHVKLARRELLMAIKEELEWEIAKGGNEPQTRRKKIMVE